MDGNEPSKLSYESYTFDEHCSAMFRLSQIRSSVTSALCAITADAVNSSFESFSSLFYEIKFCLCESALTKNRLWTIKFKRTAVVIKAILIWIWPKSFNKDLHSKMHQFIHRFQKNFPQTPLLVRGKTRQHLGSPPPVAHARRPQPSHFQNHSDAHSSTMVVSQKYVFHNKVTN